MRVRTAIAGLGTVARDIHLPACLGLPEVEVVGGCDPSPDARRNMQRKFGIPAVFADVDDLLRNAAPELVLVGTPPASHFEICRKALLAGAHVLCEKPFMMDLAQADEIVNLAAQRNLVIRVNNQYRYMSIYRETKHRIETGEFGKPHYIQCWQQMFHPPEWETNWRNSLHQYLLFEFGTHALDLLCFFFDDLPEAVSMFTPRFRQEWKSDVLVTGVLQFPGERIATLSLNRATHAPRRYLEMRVECENASVRISLGGLARVSVEWSGEARRPVLRAALMKGGESRAERGGRSTRIASARGPEFAAATREHLREFLRDMGGPRRPLRAAMHARDVLQLVFMGYESARTGETVRRDRFTAGAGAPENGAATASLHLG